MQVEGVDEIHAGSTGVIELNSAYWKPIGPPDAPKGWKYKNPNLGLPSEKGVSKIQLKTGPRGGSVQIQGKGHLWPFPITGSQDSIEVVLGIGEFAFCAEFSADREADFRANDRDWNHVKRCWVIVRFGDNLLLVQERKIFLIAQVAGIEDEQKLELIPHGPVNTLVYRGKHLQALLNHAGDD